MCSLSAGLSVKGCINNTPFEPRLTLIVLRRLGALRPPFRLQSSARGSGGFNTSLCMPPASRFAGTVPTWSRRERRVPDAGPVSAVTPILCSSVGGVDAFGTCECSVPPVRRTQRFMGGASNTSTPFPERAFMSRVTRRRIGLPEARFSACIGMNTSPASES